MTALSILQATLAALNLGAAYTHLLEMRPKRAMAGKDWLTTQHAYGDFGTVAGMTMPMSTALSLARAPGAPDPGTRGHVRRARPLHPGDGWDLGDGQQARQPGDRDVGPG